MKLGFLTAIYSNLFPHHIVVPRIKSFWHLGAKIDDDIIENNTNYFSTNKTGLRPIGNNNSRQICVPKICASENNIPENNVSSKLHTPKVSVIKIKTLENCWFKAGIGPAGVGKINRPEVTICNSSTTEISAEPIRKLKSTARITGAQICSIHCRPVHYCTEQ